MKIKRWKVVNNGTYYSASVDVVRNGKVTRERAVGNLPINALLAAVGKGKKIKVRKNATGIIEVNIEGKKSHFIRRTNIDLFTDICEQIL